jgi:Mor family transcriptional regulator
MKDEEVFMEQLLSTHFLDLSTEKLYESTRKLIRKLKEVELLGEELIEKVRSHNEKIASAIENVKQNRERDLVKDHMHIGKDFENLILKYRYVKKKIFAVIKEIMIHHKQKLLLNKT